MEFVINSNTIISLATLITALGAIFGVIRWGFKYVEHDKEQDKKLEAVQKTQTVTLYGVLACLKGLKEQGCDGPVEETLKQLEKHLIETVHNG